MSSTPTICLSIDLVLLRGLQRLRRVLTRIRHAQRERLARQLRQNAAWVAEVYATPTVAEEAGR